MQGVVDGEAEDPGLALWLGDSDAVSLGVPEGVAAWDALSDCVSDGVNVLVLVRDALGVPEELGVPNALLEPLWLRVGELDTD